MGLWIAGGLLAAERGRVWAENRLDGGAEFTVAIPAPVMNAPGTVATSDDTSRAQTPR